MNYPIYWNKKQQESLKNLLNEKKSNIKAGNQGSDIEQVMGADFLERLKEINPKVGYYSLNYHACEGKAGTMIVATIGLGNNWTDCNKIGDNQVRGFKVICSEYTCGGYLNNYLRFGENE